MADQPKPKKEFTHIGVEKRTQRKVALLAQVLGPKMFELVELWADKEWEKAVKKGLVTDAMLTAHWVGLDTPAATRPAGGGSGKKAVGSDQLSVGSDQSSVISDQSSVGSDQLSVSSDQSSVISGKKGGKK